MKKLLFLAAILFMAPITAGWTVSLNDTGTTVELSVFEAMSDNMEGLAMVIEAPGLLTNFVDGPQAPMTFLFDTVTINGDSGGQFWLFLQPPAFVDGVWFIADWSASVPVWVSAYAELDHGSGWVLVDQILVPEPMTIAMLGLGGLLIFRNRRR